MIRGQSLIPGERDLTPDEMVLIRAMHDEGSTWDDIAAQLPGVEAGRIAAMLAPRYVPKRPKWKGRRRC